MGTIFPKHLLTACLCVSQYFRFLNHDYTCYGGLWSVTFDVTIVIVRGHRRPLPCKSAHSVDKSCVCTLSCSPISLLLLRPPCSLRHNNVEIRLNGNPTIASLSVQMKGKSSLLSLFKSEAKKWLNPVRKAGRSADRLQAGCLQTARLWKQRKSSWRKWKVLLQWAHEW